MIHNLKDISTKLAATPSQATHPRGFTLVELLVTISVFLVLITLTATLIRRTSDGEKIRTAASQLQAYVEGARARAFQQKKPIGIRFILDKDDPSTASSMVYLETTPPEKGLLDFFPADYLTASSGSLTTLQIYTPTTGYLATNTISKKVIGQRATSSSISWKKLKDIGMLVPGTKVFIASRPYIVQSGSFYANVDKEPVQALEIVPDFSGNETTPMQNYELFTSAVPMKNVIPTELPRGTTIDFQSSKLPGNWGSLDWSSGLLISSSDRGKYIIPNAKNTQKRFFKIAQTGTTGTTEPDWDSIPTGTVITDNTVKYDILSTAQLDIMFSPSGAVDGAISAEGVLRFVLAKKEDTDADLRVEDLLNSDNQPRGDQIIVSLYTLSGALSISQIDPTDKVENANPTNTTPDNKADNAFNFAESGEESK